MFAHALRLALTVALALVFALWHPYYILPSREEGGVRGTVGAATGARGAAP